MSLFLGTKQSLTPVQIDGSTSSSNDTGQDQTVNNNYSSSNSLWSNMSEFLGGIFKTAGQAASEKLVQKINPPLKQINIPAYTNTTTVILIVAVLGVALFFFIRKR